MRALALGGLAWLALLAAMAAAGYASPARYGLPAAACACVLAGVGAATLAERVRGAATEPGRVAAGWLALALLLAAALAVPAAGRLARLDDQVREGTAVARAHDDLLTVVDRAGGAAAMRRCALGGWVAVNHTTGSALVWELRVSLDRVARTMSRPGRRPRPSQRRHRRPAGGDARRTGEQRARRAGRPMGGARRALGRRAVPAGAASAGRRPARRAESRP